MSVAVHDPLRFILKIRCRTLAVLCGIAGVICALLGVDSLTTSPADFAGGLPLLLVGGSLLLLGANIWSEKRWAVIALATLSILIATVRLALLLHDRASWEPRAFFGSVGLPLLCAAYATRIIVLAKQLRSATAMTTSGATGAAQSAPAPGRQQAVSDAAASLSSDPPAADDSRAD
ncbi:MAG TPA: hypothetical protein VFE24_16810 [Pirellulales bacterium]|jgi:peptidoglycan/LPS O-acetylase OafA/YrhL|nr:hypothetical protein [Pirellulales bacterium]